MTTKRDSRKTLYIEVCGGIASGKTTLALLMRETHIETILEDFKSNPFWEDFYQNPGEYIFETEITFLLQHYNRIKKELFKGKGIICDFSLLLDLSYAHMGLKDSKLKAFLAVYDEVRRELPPPTLLVHLQCDSNTELSRIRKRARSVEHKITHDFLDNLNKALVKQIEAARNNTKVITIDSARKDFAHDESVRQEMKNLLLAAL